MKKKFLIRVLIVAILSLSFIGVNAQRHHHQKREHKHTPNYRYSKLPRWGNSYTIAPKSAVVIKHAKGNYHYHSGIFYKVQGSNYIIAKAPIGVRVSVLPKAKIKLMHKGKKYFYYYGTFYNQTDDGKEFITVEPPIGAIIDALPEGYNEIKFNGEDLYEFEGTYYKPIANEDNEEWYEVVKTK